MLNRSPQIDREMRGRGGTALAATRFGLGMPLDRDAGYIVLHNLGLSDGIPLGLSRLAQFPCDDNGWVNGRAAIQIQERRANCGRTISSTRSLIHWAALGETMTTAVSSTAIRPAKKTRALRPMQAPWLTG
jgi:hypothetical protein